MITTKRSELHVINSFNELMADTKEKEKIGKLIKQSCNDYFAEKISDSELNNITIYEVFKDLTTRKETHCYEIAKSIKDKIIDDYSYDEEYYDGAVDKNGFQVVKFKKVLDRNRVGKDFGEDFEESICDLVREDYFKNLNKALEIYNFENKIDALEQKNNKRVIKNNLESIKNIVSYTIKGLYLHYVEEKYDAETIITSFKYNNEVNEYIYTKILRSIDDELHIKVSKADIRDIVDKELKRFINSIDARGPIKEEGIPTIWKFYAVTKFMNSIFK